MSKTARARTGGTIPAQPGPRDAADASAPEQQPGPQSGIVSAEGDMSGVSVPTGSDTDAVILGAGPGYRSVVPLTRARAVRDVARAIVPRRAAAPRLHRRRPDVAQDRL